ncbi:uncharacterized protein LOC129643696 isoform X3 [Bubalus kerabau]|uniref:uncharacterized protein LOC129643696 isoform X3 n=1 Tax=Bubalus carabanensis TaxID=3119969 RepID=UPI00244E731B|nr:uncharacterized protein LOC129643696 isoform X3 [Bubalus carabanensis]
MFDPSFNAGFTAVLLSDSKPLESAEASTFFMQSCLRALPPTGVDPNNSAPDADVHLGVHSPESPFCSSPGGLSHPVVCSSTICFVLTTVSHSLTLCRAEKAKSISVQWSGPPWISVSQMENCSPEEGISILRVEKQSGDENPAFHHFREPGKMVFPLIIIAEVTPTNLSRETLA